LRYNDFQTSVVVGNKPLEAFEGEEDNCKYNDEEFSIIRFSTTTTATSKSFVFVRFL
jgi:hypothetical protein